MVINNTMRLLLERTDLDSVTHEDLTPQLSEIAAEGWMRDEEGAWLLRAWYGSYHGRRSDFTDLTGYEAAVNGRGIPDLDLPVDDDMRANKLIRRSYSFACEALIQLRRIADPPQVTAFISLAKTWTDDPVYVANITFWSRHEGEAPYFDIHNTDTSVATMSIELSDCAEWRRV